MLNQSLLQSNFIGRDGFRWWIGQIAPISTMKGQVSEGQGWGHRYKVRIIGYHPYSLEDLPNDDLPWAQVMLPTTAGTGAANYAVNPKVSPGDVVIGFFLDGDNAQVPVIMGALGNTSQIATLNSQFTTPFVPFTGYTDNIKKPNGRLIPDQTSESNVKSNPSPVLLPPDKTPANKVSASTSIGKEVVFADTCEDTSIKTIKNEINNLLKDIQDAKNKVSDYKQKADAVVDIIVSCIEWQVGQMFDGLFTLLCGDETATPPKPGLITEGLDKLYKTVFGATLAATGNPGVAQQAGVAALEPFVPAVKTLEEAISCVAAQVINGLKALVKALLQSLIDNVKNFVSCAAEQFVGALLNAVVDAIATGLTTALDGVASILGTALDVADFLRSTSDLIKSIGGLFDCNQNQNKCSGLTKEYVIGQGPKQSVNAISTFENIYNNLNNMVAQAGDLAGQAQGYIGSFENITQTLDIFNPETALNNALSGLEGCYAGIPFTCGPPVVNIFGGGGTGASAVPLFGSIVPNELINNVNRTASIIGTIVTDGGSGYTVPPFVEFVDSCGLGYGAVGRALINDQGQVTSVYMVSSGENYPVGDTDSYAVTDVYVQSPGYGYSNGDTATDNLGNQYALTIDDGAVISATPINKIEVAEDVTIEINSATGTGAILKPILGLSLSIPNKELKTQIDCIT
jgi:hypothetical protein